MASRFADASRHRNSDAALRQFSDLQRHAKRRRLISAWGGVDTGLLFDGGGVVGATFSCRDQCREGATRSARLITTNDAQEPTASVTRDSTACPRKIGCCQEVTAQAAASIDADIRAGARAPRGYLRVADRAKVLALPACADNKRMSVCLV